MFKRDHQNKVLPKNVCSEKVHTSPVYMTLVHKTSHKSHGYTVFVTIANIVWDKIKNFSFKIRILKV